jgi:hypothetical protein
MNLPFVSLAIGALLILVLWACHYLRHYGHRWICFAVIGVLVIALFYSIGGRPHRRPPL